MRQRTLRLATMLFLLQGFGLSWIARGDTYVQGAVSGMWTETASPYFVTADIYVDAGDTLAVMPGAQVVFSPNCNLRVYGCLLVYGDSLAPVYFTADSLQPGSWGGIFIESTLDSSAFSHAAIEYALVGVTVDGGVASFDNVHFSNNVNGLDCKAGGIAWLTDVDFQANTNAAVRVESAWINMRGCILRGNSLGGITSTMLLTDCVNAEVYECEFYDNSTTALEVTGGNKNLVVNNVFAFNDYGVYVASDTCLIASNIFYYNTVGVAIDSANPVVRYNDFWGNTNSDFLNPPQGAGEPSTQNPRGTPSDSLFNIYLDPQFVDEDVRDFRIKTTSPCVDAGDPTNPASIPFNGLAPDIGAHETGAALPVQLVSLRFAGGALRWRTESEKDNWGFVVERSTDGVEWQRVGFVPGHRTTAQAHDYAFVDPDPVTGRAYYRVIQVDVDGTRTVYGPVVATAAQKRAARLSIYPNPTNSSAVIRARFAQGPEAPAEAERNATFSVYDLTGRLVRQFEVPVAGGRLTLRWDGLDQAGRAAASGTYTVVVRYAGQRLAARLTLLR